MFIVKLFLKTPDTGRVYRASVTHYTAQARVRFYKTKYRADTQVRPYKYLRYSMLLKGRVCDPPKKRDNYKPSPTKKLRNSPCF